MALLGAKVRLLWSAHNSDLSVVKGLVKDATENIYQPAIIDPKEKQQYIYEVSVRFPAAAQRLENFRYKYYPADNNMKAQIIVASNQSLAAAYNALGSEVFKNIPTYQRCSKEFIVQFDEGIDQPDFKLAAAKPLADGRTAYLYKNITCDKLFNDNSVNVAGHQHTLEAIESY
jgi:hypothetical protein